MKPLEEYTSIEELKQAYKRAIEYYMRLHVIADNVNELAMTQMTPDAFCSLLVQDCLEEERPSRKAVPFMIWLVALWLESQMWEMQSMPLRKMFLMKRE